MRTTSPLAALPPATVHSLGNGLVLIVREDHSAPVVSVQAWCRSGSMHEGRWLGAGLSHVLEHMLFKGTTRRSGARIDQEIQEAGGYLNAYTSFDRTVYWINVPNTGTTVAVDILADIFQHATLPDDELAREMDVIRREMDMNHDDPARHSSRRLFETAYRWSACRFPVIGYPELFNQLRPQDIRDYYRDCYAPNHVFFVVVGDVQQDAVLQQLVAAFAGSAPRPRAPIVLPTEPRQTSPRDVVEEAPIELGHFHLGWHVPDVRHADMPALDVLASLLGMGRSSRLYRQVREKRALVHSVDAWVCSPGAPGLLGLSAVADAGKVPRAQAALLAEISRMQEREVSGAELAKAVRQFLAGSLATRKTMQGQAQDLGGCWLAADDLHFSDRYLAAVGRVRPADLRRVAGEYLTEENRTSYALVPRGSRAVPRVTFAAARGERPFCWTMPNGLRVLFKEDHRLPFVELRLVLRGGVLAENPDNNGISLLLSRMLLKGTQQRTAAQLAQEIESVGGSAESYAGNNSVGLSLEVLADDTELGLRHLSEMLLESAFPERELERERAAQVAAIRSRRDELLKNAALALRRALFGDRGYGLDVLGTETAVLGLGRSQVSNFHAALLRPDLGVLAVFGDIDVRHLQRRLLRHLGGWQRAKAAPPVHLDSESSLAEPAPGLRRIKDPSDKKQAVLVIGFPGTTLRDPDRFALELLQEACSDLGSRLFLRIRERLGLAYYVGAQNFVGLVPGYFALYAGTAPDKAAAVEAELLAEARLLTADGLTAEELRRAQAKVIGQRKIARQELGNLAMTLALDELYGLGFEYSETEDARYEAVTCDDLRRVAARFLDPDRAVVASTGKV